jgi:hypothetical protein
LPTKPQIELNNAPARVDYLGEVVELGDTHAIMQASVRRCAYRRWCIGNGYGATPSCGWRSRQTTYRNWRRKTSQRRYTERELRDNLTVVEPRHLRHPRVQ